MKIKLVRQYTTKARETDLAYYIESSLTRTFKDGYVEQAMETAQAAARTSAKLIALLVDKKIITLQEAKEIIPHCDEIEEA